MKSENRPWLELVQLVPVVSFALPFILRGEVELARAGSGFLLGAVLFMLVSWLVVSRKGVLNPVLVGTGVWLLLGAAAFEVPIDALASILSATRGFSLFVVIVVIGAGASLLSRGGFVGTPSRDPAWVRRASWLLLAVAVVAAAWAFRFRANIRLGGGLPFIVLNAARRVVMRRMT